MFPRLSCYNMIKIKVPATSANMGAGFDSMGVALGLYNVVEIMPADSGLQIYNVNAKSYIPRDENNLIYRAMAKVFERTGYTPGGLKIIQKSDIPMTRGLGSSSACIIAGMVGANVLSGRKLSYQELLDMAVEMEGHPDNVSPALFGGLCVSAMDHGRTYCKSTKLDPKIKFAVMIPDFFVATKKSRGVLPEQVSRKDAVFNISRAALMYACLASGDTSMLRVAAQDRLHQPYRKGYVEGLSDIFDKAYAAGAKAVYLSGSGPTVLAVLDGSYGNFKKEMERFFQENAHQWTCKILSIDNVGTVVKTAFK